LRRSLPFFLLAAAVLLPASTPIFGAATAMAAPACTIVGTSGPDHLRGTGGADVICGGGGDDTIRGLGDDDVLIGGAGNDKLVGGPGDDTLRGGSGRDELLGGPGDDELDGGAGGDRVFGGAGRNYCTDRSTSVASGCGAPTSPPRKPPTVRTVAPLPPTAEPKPYTPPTIPPEPPYLESLEFVHENVEIASGDWWVRLDAKAWGQSGIASVEAVIEGPDGLWRKALLQGSGAATVQSLALKLPVPDSTPVGQYRVTAVTVVDNRGGSTSYGSTALLGGPLAAQFEVYDGPDREGPNLESLSFEPIPLDTSSGPVEVHVPITVSDPGSGVNAVRLQVANPTEQGFVEERRYRPTATLVSGTAREGTWMATIPLPSGGAAGFYPVARLELEDNEEHWHVYGARSLEEEGFPGGFTEVGPADATKPRVTSFTIETPVIHSDRGEDKLEVEIGAADDWSGIADWPDPVGRIRFSLEPPQRVSWGASGDGTVLVSGTEHDGVWHHDLWLGEDAIQGTWKVRYIELRDRAGNVTRLEDASLEEFEDEGWDLSFENLP
jgi:hypothetical protein